MDENTRRSMPGAMNLFYLGISEDVGGRRLQMAVIREMGIQKELEEENSGRHGNQRRV